MPLEAVTCQLGGTTQAVCTMSVTVSAFTSKELQTTTLSGSEITLFPVVVTAGQQLLASAGSVSAGTGSGVVSTEATASTSNARNSGSSTSRTGGSETSTSATASASGTSGAAGNTQTHFSYAIGAILAAAMVAVAAV